MQLTNPEYIYLTVLLVPYIIWYVWKQRRAVVPMRFSDIRSVLNTHRTLRQRLLHFPFVLRCISLALLIVILARPYYTNSWQKQNIEGIDIMLAIDVSTSMLAQDLKPNRLEAAKQVAADFVRGRPDDNIGLTLFAGAAFAPVPLTLDHETLLSQLTLAQARTIEDGTAIGMGIATALNKLRHSKAKSKTIILLTDGSNNMGEISPMTAADIAYSLGIRVYTIGVGTQGMARTPVSTPVGIQYFNIPVEIDTETLQQIASNTDAHFYRATSTDKLREIYNDIDKLERTKMEVQTYHRNEEAYAPFAIALLICLLLESLLKLTYLRTNLNT